MTETAETIVEPAAPIAHRDRPNRLYQAAAWVAIVAGVVFIVGAVFFTGFALGRHSGVDGPRHRGVEFVPRPMMERGGPGMGPGMMGPGMMGDPDRQGPATTPSSRP